jgi:hypothetical protein
MTFRPKPDSKKDLLEKQNIVRKQKTLGFKPNPKQRVHETVVEAFLTKEKDMYRPY